LAAELFLLVSEQLNDQRAASESEALVAAGAASIPRWPVAFGHLLGVADTIVNGTVQIALVTPDSCADLHAEVHRYIEVIARRHVPALVLAVGRAGDDSHPLLAGKAAQRGETTAYLCRRYLCSAPVTDA